MKIEREVNVDGKRFRLCLESADAATHSYMSTEAPQVRAALDLAGESVKHIIGNQLSIAPPAGTVEVEGSNLNGTR